MEQSISTRLPVLSPNAVICDEWLEKDGAESRFDFIGRGAATRTRRNPLFSGKWQLFAECYR